MDAIAGTSCFIALSKFKSGFQMEVPILSSIATWQKQDSIELSSSQHANPLAHVWRQRLCRVSASLTRQARISASLHLSTDSRPSLTAAKRQTRLVRAKQIGAQQLLLLLTGRAWRAHAMAEWVEARRQVRLQDKENATHRTRKQVLRRAKRAVFWAEQALLYSQGEALHVPNLIGSTVPTKSNKKGGTSGAARRRQRRRKHQRKLKQIKPRQIMAQPFQIVFSSATIVQCQTLLTLLRGYHFMIREKWTLARTAFLESDQFLQSFGGTNEAAVALRAVLVAPLRYSLYRLGNKDVPPVSVSVIQPSVKESVSVSADGEQFQWRQFKFSTDNVNILNARSSSTLKHWRKAIQSAHGLSSSLALYCRWEHLHQSLVADWERAWQWRQECRYDHFLLFGEPEKNQGKRSFKEVARIYYDAHQRLSLFSSLASQCDVSLVPSTEALLQLFDAFWSFYQGHQSMKRFQVAEAVAYFDRCLNASKKCLSVDANSVKADFPNLPLTDWWTAAETLQASAQSRKDHVIPLLQLKPEETESALKQRQKQFSSKPLVKPIVFDLVWPLVCEQNDMILDESSPAVQNSTQQQQATGLTALFKNLWRS